MKQRVIEGLAVANDGKKSKESESIVTRRQPEGLQADE